MADPAPGFEKHPNYKVTIEPQAAELVVKVGATEVARSRRALLVEESKHRPVWYLPMDDVDGTLLEATATHTYRPCKAHASYWRINAADGVVEDALWGYLSPYDECEALRDHVSFYTNKVDLYVDGALSNKDGPGWHD